MKDLMTLIQKIAENTYRGTLKPVTVQTGIMESETEVTLDQNLSVKPTLSKVFSDGLEVHIEGVINGHEVSGDLTLTRKLNPGDKVKIIKEDGTNKYFVAEQL